MLSEGYDSHGERKANPLGKNHRELPLKQGTPERLGGGHLQVGSRGTGRAGTMAGAQ
jgi:hypothetical protein